MTSLRGGGGPPPSARFDRLAVSPLFPTCIYCRDHPGPDALNGDLLALGERMRRQDPEGNIVSGRGAWQSQPVLQAETEAQPLMRFVMETLEEVRGFLRIAPTAEFLISSSWINVNGPGGYNRTHIHGNSYFSGVYYVRTPPDSGLIEFRDPSYLREYFHLDYVETTTENCFSQSYQPMAGRMFVFPGYLPHAVGENRSGEERVSISFNVSARRRAGEH